MMKRGYGVMEATLVLGTSGEIRLGSNPSIPTKITQSSNGKDAPVRVGEIVVRICSGLQYDEETCNSIQGFYF